MPLDDRLVRIWLEQLQGWALDGRLLTAALGALRINASEPPEDFITLVDRLSRGDFDAIPDIECLPGSSMPGAAGAYADSDSRIYLNQDWLNEADENAVIEVLTEEFGHHLDNLYNRRDTRGDEGKHFLHLIEHGLGPGFDHQNDQPGIDNDDHGV